MLVARFHNPNPPPALRLSSAHQVLENNWSLKKNLFRRYVLVDPVAAFKGLRAKRIEWVSSVVDVAIMSVAISRDSSRVFSSSSPAAAGRRNDVASELDQAVGAGF